MLTRPTLGAAWTQIIHQAALGSDRQEWRAAISEDELAIVLASDRMGGSGGPDLWESQRATTAVDFPAPTQTLVAALNDAGAQWDPELSRDGLRLYYAPSEAAMQRIMVATRPTVTSSFGAPMAVSGVDLGVPHGDPALSPDERVILYSSTAADGMLDLWFATRPDAVSPFENPTTIAELNTSFDDGGGDVSFDGCERLLTSNRSGTNQIYAAVAL